MLFGSNILEVAIAVVFVYLLLSLVCTALNEGIASLLDKRGHNLVEGIKNLLNDPKFTGLAQQVYNHGLIGGISQYASDPKKRTRLPSYMSPTGFSLALLDILSARGAIASQYGDLLANAEKADDAHEQALQAAAAAPNDPRLAEVVNRTKAVREEATKALESILAQAKTAHDQAVRSFRAAPDDASLAAAVTQAKNTADSIHAAMKMLDARRAAVASSRKPREIELLHAAGTSLKEALAFARELAAQYPDPLSNIQEGLKRLPEGHTRETLLVLVDKTRREVAEVSHQAEAFRQNLEDWFNSSMDRVGGWYKRWTQRVLLALSTAIVIATNADTVMLVERLSKDNILRASVVAAAEETVRTRPVPTPAEPSHEGAASGSATPAIPQPATPLASATPEKAINDTPDLQKIMRTAEELKLPVGWSRNPEDAGYFPWPAWTLEYARWVFYKAIGLFISILAVSLGAPFWFDTLSKFVNLRSSGTPPGETAKSAPRPSVKR